MTENIQWYISARQEGKTHALVNWVKGGRKVSYWPYWDRVILVSSRREADILRRPVADETRYDLDYHQVFTVDEWKKGIQSRIRGPIVLGIDNIEYFLNRMLFNTGYSQIAMITGTGELLVPERGQNVSKGS